MEDLINRLIDLVQKAAPELWSMALTQVRAETYGRAALAVLFLLSSLLTLLFLYSTLEDEDKREYRPKEGYINKPGKMYIENFSLVMSRTLGTIVATTILFIGFYEIYEVIVRAVNPSFYALQILTNLVR